MRYIGIDYSFNSPSACVHDGATWDFKNCQFFFLTGSSKIAPTYLNGAIESELIKPYSTDTERFLKNAHAFKNFIKPTHDDLITIEGYAFGATGSRIFQIGEASGILKTLLIHSMTGELINNGRSLETVPPMSVKKFASGKGNADKQLMFDSFVTETGIDLVNVFGMKKLGNPVHDIIDAYWICKFGYTKHMHMSPK